MFITNEFFFNDFFSEIGLNEPSLGQKCQKRMKQKSPHGFTQSRAAVVAPLGQL